MTYHVVDMALYNVTYSLQFLGLVCAGAERGDEDAAPTLVVLPKALLSQWAAEAEKHCGASLVVATHHGAVRGTGTELFRGADLVLTTYGMVRARPRHAAPMARGPCACRLRRRDR